MAEQLRNHEWRGKKYPVDYEPGDLCLDENGDFHTVDYAIGNALICTDGYILICE